MTAEASAAAHSDERRRRAATAMAAIWREAKPGIVDQVRVIGNAARARDGGTLSDDLRAAAHGEAHKLAGSLGTFGFIEASRLARRLEGIFEEHPRPSEEAAGTTELAASLLAEVEAATSPRLTKGSHDPP